MDSWWGVEVRHLTALTAIEKERSFRGAADRLGYVQSAVSQQISRLERLVGTRLVERSRGQSQVELTPAGKLLLKHADRVLAQLQAAKSDLLTAADGSTETLRVGAFESVAVQIMPPVLARLAIRRPDVQVVTTDVPADSSLFEAVERGELDVAFAELPHERGPFDGRRLISDPCVLLVERDSALAVDDRVPTLPEIAALPLVSHPAWRMTELIDAHFRAAGLQPNYRYWFGNNAAIQAVVAKGLAAAIMARLSVNEENPHTRMIELEALPHRTLGIYWHSERVRSPALDAFIETVDEVCADLFPQTDPNLVDAELAELAELPTELAE
jgi:DNA-binding transcriptional LysR family regulator